MDAIVLDEAIVDLAALTICKVSSSSKKLQERISCVLATVSVDST